MKSPDQIRQETADLIQRLENEKKQQEELAKKLREKSVYTVDDLEKTETENTEIPGIIYGSKSRNNEDQDR